MSPRLWHVLRFLLNLPFTVLAVAWGIGWRGGASIAPGLIVVCSGMRWGWGFRGGVTIGCALLTGSQPPIAPELLRHEGRHADQWAIFPVIFPLLYGVAELAARGDPRRNIFERWAGLEDGGYL